MIRTHYELEVYKLAYKLSMEIFHLSKKFPKEETYSLTDQVRRSSRSVCANISEAWRSRRYPKSYRNILNISEREAAETQTWLHYSKDCGYINESDFNHLHDSYDEVLAQLVYLSKNYKKWCTI